jgi:PAS domain-containing protein
MPITDFAARFVADTPEAVLFADHDGIIRFWDAGCERRFGHTASEAVGQSLDIIIPEAQRTGRATPRPYARENPDTRPVIFWRCPQCARMAREFHRVLDRPIPRCA